MPINGTHYFNYSVDKYQRYEGQFENYLKKGKGKFFYPGGGTYEGEIDQDMRNGNGIYIDKDFNQFDGNWKDNLLHGKGKISFYNKDIY